VSTTTLITILIILLIVLIPLLLSYLVFPDEKVGKKIQTIRQKEVKPEILRDKPLSFEQVQQIFAYKQSSKDELQFATEQLIKHHGKIHAKLGDLPHPDFKRYLNLIIILCANPQADKDVIVALDQKLRAKNPKYGLNIDEAVNKGIASRNF
jgi:hypothetical protein